MNDFRIAETGMTCWVIGIRVSKKLGVFLGVLVVTVIDFYYIGVSASMATTREVLGIRPHTHLIFQSLEPSPQQLPGTR